MRYGRDSGTPGCDHGEERFGRVMRHRKRHQDGWLTGDLDQFAVQPIVGEAVRVRLGVRPPLLTWRAGSRRDAPAPGTEARGVPVQDASSRSRGSGSAGGMRELRYGMAGRSYPPGFAD